VRAPFDGRLDGSTALVTGANTGIGRTAALSLARRGATVIVTARSEARAQPVVDEIVSGGGRAIPWALELSDLDAVARSARALLDRGFALDRLVFNAGLAGQRGLTRQGFELTFGVNHLAHFLLGELLLPRALERPHPRVVVVASNNHYHPRALDLGAVREPTATRTGLREYGLSKLANVMTAMDWAEQHRAAGLTAVSLNPGRVASDIWRRIPNPFRWLFMQTMRTVEQGAYTTVHCATLPRESIETGGYYDDCAPRPASPVALDPQARAALRRASLEWVGPHLS
jgi:retinol dehydrogenase-12